LATHEDVANLRACTASFIDVSRRLDLIGELRPEHPEIFMQGSGGVA
jgi:hypothetical protein